MNFGAWVSVHEGASPLSCAWRVHACTYFSCDVSVMRVSWPSMTVSFRETLTVTTLVYTGLLVVQLEVC